MKIDKLIPYAEDYKNITHSPSDIWFFHIRTDFDFVMSIPGMEDRVYYKKTGADTVRDRLNAQGIYLEICYRIKDREITDVSVVFDSFCRAVFREKQECEHIVGMVLSAKESAATAFCS